MLEGLDLGQSGIRLGGELLDGFVAVLDLSDLALELVQPLTPGLSLAEQRKKSAMILALLQGLPLLLGKGVRVKFPIGDLHRTLKDEILATLRIAKR